MFKNKTILCVAALLIAVLIGSSIYAAVADASLISKMMPLRVLTPVSWISDNEQDDAAGDTSVTATTSETVAIATASAIGAAAVNADEMVCPLESACETSDEEVASENNEKPWLGVSVTAIHKALLAQLPVLSGIDHGVMIENVVEESPAMIAGLKQYDLITRINDQQVNSTEQLAELIGNYNVGDEIAMTYVREGSEVGVKVKLQANPHVATTASLKAPWFAPLGTFEFDMNWFNQDWSGLSAMPNVSVNNNAKSQSWSESQSMKISRDSDGNFDVSIQYKKNGDSIERSFKGTKEEVLKAIDDDDELSDTVKKRLKGSLTDGKLKQRALANEMASKIKKHFDEPFFNDSFMNADPLQDAWITKNWMGDNWLNKDWFKGPGLFNDRIFEVLDDSGLKQEADDSTSAAKKN